MFMYGMVRSDATDYKDLASSLHPVTKKFDVAIISLSPCMYTSFIVYKYRKCQDRGNFAFKLAYNIGRLIANVGLLRPLALAYTVLIQLERLPIIPHKLMLRVWRSEARMSSIYRSAVLLLTVLLILGVVETSSGQTHDITAAEARYPSQGWYAQKTNRTNS